MPSLTPDRSRRQCPVNRPQIWPGSYRSYEDIEMPEENQSSRTCVTVKHHFAVEFRLKNDIVSSFLVTAIDVSMSFSRTQ